MDDTCRTGLSNCTASICAYLDDDGSILNDGVLLTNEDGETQFELLRLGVCPTPVAVAIGGGGATGGGGTLGGGGSGYVSYSVLPPTPYVKLLAFAGGPGEDSFLKFLNSTIILTGT